MKLHKQLISMVKFEKRNLVLLAGCLGLLLLPLVCFLLPWVPFLGMFKDPRSKPTVAKPPQATSQPQSIDLKSTTNTNGIRASILPPSLTRIQDLTGLEISTKVMEKIESLKNAEIKLVGSVIDESGKGLQDVEVVWTLGYVPSHLENRGSIKTDENGAFLIDGVVSPTIHLTPYKKGYSAQSESVGTWFADIPSSNESPLKLIMRKD
jgi:hypothetical protein